MLPRLMASALFVAGLCTVASMAQPPANPNKSEKKADKAVDPTQTAIAAALAHDPDVSVARAKVQLAEAELAKAKQAVVLRVMNLNATIRELKAAVSVEENNVSAISPAASAGIVPPSKILEARAKLEAAQAALARAETELKLLTGGGTPTGLLDVPAGGSDRQGAAALEWLERRMAFETGFDVAAALVEKTRREAVKGPVAERLRASLDKRVKLGAKGERVPFEKALETFKKEAGLDISVRYGAHTGSIDSILSEGEELPIVAWFQLYQDSSGQGFFYVRDYGLLFANKTTAPPDAPTLTEYWKKLGTTPKTDEPKK